MADRPQHCAHRLVLVGLMLAATGTGLTQRIPQRSAEPAQRAAELVDRLEISAPAVAECGPLLAQARDAFEQLDAAQLSAAGADRRQPYHDAVDAVVRCAEQHLTAAQIDLVYRFLRDEAWHAQAAPVEGLIARSQPPISTSRHTELSDQYTRAELEAIRDQVLMEEAKKVPGVQGAEPSRLAEQHPVKVRSLAPVEVVATAAPAALGEPPWAGLDTPPATVDSLRGLFVEQPRAVTRYFWQDVGPLLVARVQAVTPAAQMSPPQPGGTCWYRGERLPLDNPACCHALGGEPVAADGHAGHALEPGDHEPPPLQAWCCRGGEVYPAPPPECEERGGRVFGDREEAERRCRHDEPHPGDEPRWCCLHGEVHPAPPPECEERGGRVFGNREEAERHCRHDQPRPGDESGWCCLHGEVFPTSAEECRGNGGEVFAQPEEAERHCRGRERLGANHVWCCWRDQVHGGVGADCCMAAGGRVFESAWEAEQACESRRPD